MTDRVTGGIERAAMLLDAGRAVDAERLARQAVAATPDDPAAFLILARSLERQAKHDAMLTVATRAAALDPESARSHLCRSDALSLLERRMDAVAAARQAVRLAPSWWLPHARLAEALAAAGNHRPPWHVTLDLSRRALVREAVRHGQRGVALAPEAAGAWVAFGIALASAGRRRASSRAYRRSLRLDPTSAAAANNLAVLAVGRGRLSRASGLFLAAARSEPAGGVWIDNLGVVVLRTMRSATLVMIVADTMVGALALAGAGRFRALVVLGSLLFAVARLAHVGRTFPRHALSGTLRRLWPGTPLRYLGLRLVVVTLVTLAVGFGPAGFWDAVLGGSSLSVLVRLGITVALLRRGPSWLGRDDDQGANPP